MPSRLCKPDHVRMRWMRPNRTSAGAALASSSPARVGWKEVRGSAVGALLIALGGCGINASSSHFTAVTEAVATQSSLPLLTIEQVLCQATNPGEHLQFDVQDAGSGVQGLEVQVTRTRSGISSVVQTTIMDLSAGSAATVHVYDSAGQGGDVYTITLDPQHQVTQDPRSQDSASATAPPSSDG